MMFLGRANVKCRRWAWLCVAACVMLPRAYGDMLSDDGATAVLWHMDSKYYTGLAYFTPDDDRANWGRDSNLELNYTYGDCDITAVGGGFYGEALAFDGDDIAVAKSAWRASYAGVRIDFWLKINSLVSEDDTSYLLHGSGPWWLSIGGEQLKWLVFDDSNSEVGRLMYSIPPTLVGTWVHIVTEYSPVHDSLRLEINDTVLLGDTTGKMWQKEGDIHVGGVLGKPPGRGLNGLMDEVKITWYPANPVCGDWGYFPSDLNQDCTVDIEDLNLLLHQWLKGG